MKNNHQSSVKSYNLYPEYTEEEKEFMIAVDRYKRKYQRPYPTCSEILQVLKDLGYRKESLKLVKE